MKDQRLIFRVTSDEKNQIENICYKNNIKISDFIRDCIFKRERKTIRILSKSEKEILQNMIFEINKIGININQIAYFFNLENLKKLQEKENILTTFSDEHIKSAIEILNILNEKYDNLESKLKNIYQNESD
jgi:TRAP-type mannitol/chloroaromatic compound transport system substrate-binding protein